MAAHKLALSCYHPDCAADPPLEVVVEERDSAAAAGLKKEKLVYCAHNHPNIIAIPATWDVRHPVLGNGDEGDGGSPRGDDVIDVIDGTPVVRGRKP